MTSAFEPLAAEAARLLGAVREHVPATDGSCRYCPVCLAIGVLRGERPEVSEKLAAAGTALLVTLRQAFEAAPATPPTTPPPAGDGERRERPEPPRSRVQRIDLD